MVAPAYARGFQAGRHPVYRLVERGVSQAPVVGNEPDALRELPDGILQQLHNALPACAA